MTEANKQPKSCVKVLDLRMQDVSIAILSALLQLIR
jgi:hypothetical protein